MFKRGLLLILALAMLTVAFASCGGDDTKNPSVTTSQPSGSQNPGGDSAAEPALPEGLDFDFETVTVHIRDDDETIKEMGLEEETAGEALSAELFRRNEAVQAQLNVELKAAKSESWNNYNAAIASLRNSIQTGQKTFDLVAGWSPRLPILAAELLFYDLNSFEYFDVSREWWSRTMSDSMQVNGKLFMATGDLSTTYMDEAFTVIFNTAIAEQNGYDYSLFYDVVDAGEWTIEYLNTLAKDAFITDGVDGKTAGDVFGLIMDETLNLQAFWSGSDICIIPNNGVDRPEISYDVNYIQSVYEAVRELVMDNEAVAVNSLDGNILGGSGEAHKYFAQKKALFLLARLGHLSRLTSMEGQDYGLLPIPKYSTEQKEYRTHIHACTLWSIPVDVKNADMSAAVLTAMGYHSNRLVVEAHYEKLLKLRYVKDSTAGEMIDMIYNNIYMNFDAVYNEVLGDKSVKTTLPMFIFHTLITDSDVNSVSAWWASHGSVVQSKFDEIMAGFYSEN